MRQTTVDFPAGWDAPHRNAEDSIAPGPAATDVHVLSAEVSGRVAGNVVITGDGAAAAVSVDAAPRNCCLCGWLLLFVGRCCY